MKLSSFLLLGSLIFSGIDPSPAKDLDALSRSSIWQVRYCIPTEFDVPSALARAVLERLSADEVKGVARQAFEVYSRDFVALDRGLIDQAFERGDFNRAAVGFIDNTSFGTSAYWIGELEKAAEDSDRGVAVRAIGLCGNQGDVGKIWEFNESTNSYFLMELALACYRLGDTDRYRKVIDRILELPISENLFYQNKAVECLIQTHPEQARNAWKKLRERSEAIENIQAGWMYAHILQEERLP